MKNSLLVGSCALGLLLCAGAANAATTSYKATLNADQETATVSSVAKGTATLQYNDETKELFGTIEYSGLSPQAVLLGNGACGSTGQSITELPVSDSPIELDEDSGMVMLDDEQASALAAGNLFINVSTKAFPAGEIRGQLYKADSADTCGSGGGSNGGSSDGAGGSRSGGGAGSSHASDAGTSREAVAAQPDSSGCSASGSDSAPGNALAIALGVGVAMVAFARKRA